MPFCYKCGAKIEETDRFCMQCGATVEIEPVNSKPVLNKSVGKPVVDKAPTITPPIAPVAPVQPSGIPQQPTVMQQATPVAMSFVDQQMANKQEAIKELNRMIAYFGPRQDRYDEYDRCGEKIEYFQKKRPRVRVSQGKGIAFLVIGIILAVVSLPIGLVSCTFSELSYEFNMADESAVNGSIIIWGLAFLLGIAFIIISCVKRKKYHEAVSNERYNQRYKYERRFDEISAMLTTHYKNFGPCVTGPSYTNPRILRALRDSINSGRADTIKEAINLLHTDARNSALDIQSKMNTRATSGGGRTPKTVTFFPASSFHLYQ